MGIPMAGGRGSSGREAATGGGGGGMSGSDVCPGLNTKWPRRWGRAGWGRLSSLRSAPPDGPYRYHLLDPRPGRQGPQPVDNPNNLLLITKDPSADGNKLEDLAISTQRKGQREVGAGGGGRARH